MKTRIGLVSSQAFGRSKTVYVEVADVAELLAELQKAGAQRAVLFWRDRFGDGHTEGVPFPVSTLNDTHFQWAAAPAKDGMRGIFYDRRG
jgi:hypothetical protein